MLLKLLEKTLASAAVVTERIGCEFGTAGGHVTPIRRKPDEESNQVPKRGTKEIQILDEFI